MTEVDLYNLSPTARLLCVGFLIAAVPLLWVLPLALYLLTFVIVFARQPIIPHWLVVAVQPLFIIALVAVIVFDPIKTIAERAPALKGNVKAFTKKITHPASGSYFTVVSSVAEALHGANVHGE